MNVIISYKICRLNLIKNGQNILIYIERNRYNTGRVEQYNEKMMLIGHYISLIFTLIMSFINNVRTFTNRSK